MCSFDLFVGIDYSGAKTPDALLPGLAVYETEGQGEPRRVGSPAGGKWSRRAVAEWIEGTLRDRGRVAVGIDHAFGFPQRHLTMHKLTSYDAFLTHFRKHWPTDEAEVTVESLRKANALLIGEPSELRLTDTWTASAKSVFRFDVQGQVAKSTHAGLPWLDRLRRQFGAALHFWPFDGWEVPEGASLIAEAYPSIIRGRYDGGERTTDEHDAYSVARWLAETTRTGRLAHYLHPLLTEEQRARARLEGWILGVA